MVESVEMIRFFTSFRMTTTTNSPIATQSLKGGDIGEGKDVKKDTLWAG
jgi:hypothetical protein